MFDLEQEHFWFVGKRLFIQKLLETLPKKRYSILDIGSGTGGTTMWLSRFGTVTGLEKRSQARDFAKKRGIKLIPGSANKLPFQSESYDIITLFDVLYHRNLDENKTLSEAYRVLKPKGYLCITDCALPILWSKHDRQAHAKHRYTKTHLTRLVANAGFRVMRCKYIFGSLLPLFVLSRFLGISGHRPIPPAINRLFIWLLSVEASIPFPVGSSLILLAQKP